MITGIALIVLLGLVVEGILQRMRLPGLIGLLALGILLGPFGLDQLSPALMAISPELRRFALVVILLRAGFELSRETLARVGVRALLLAFIPCLIEVGVVTLVAPLLFPLTHLEGAILGSVLAAVSPAVVVPLMIQLKERGLGTEKGIPTLVLAGASIDDAVAIVLNSSFTGIYVGSSVQIGGALLRVPVEVVAGIAAGAGVGLFFFHLQRYLQPERTKLALALFATAALLVAQEQRFAALLPFSGLMGVMAMGFFFKGRAKTASRGVSGKLRRVWIFAQLLLFALVGAQVNVSLAWSAGVLGLLLIASGLLGRVLGVQLCLVKSRYNLKERLFVSLAYLPKATVQAAIGGAPLAAMIAAGRDSAPGELILALSVTAILFTAPLGAAAISLSAPRLLQKAGQGG